MPPPTTIHFLPTNSSGSESLYSPCCLEGGNSLTAVARRSSRRSDASRDEPSRTWGSAWRARLGCTRNLISRRHPQLHGRAAIADCQDHFPRLVGGDLLTLPFSVETTKMPSSPLCLAAFAFVDYDAVSRHSIEPAFEHFFFLSPTPGSGCRLWLRPCRLKKTYLPAG